MYLQPFHYFEILALLVSIACVGKTKNTVLLLFVPYLAIIVTYEIGTRLGWFLFGNSNHRVANFEMLFEFSFYILLLLAVFHKRRIKKAIYISEGIFLLIFLLNMFLEQHLNKYNSYTYILGSFIVVAWSCYLFYYLMVNTKELNLVRYPFFWIYTGIMIFCLIRFFFFTSFTFFAYSANRSYLNLWYKFRDISIISLYSCFSIGLLCFKPPLRKI
jgi:hypothetical protein